MNETDSSCPALLENEPAEQFPQEPQSIHRLLLDQLPIGVFHKDREGRFTFVNSWFCRLRGAAADEYLGKTAREVAAARRVPEDADHPGASRETTLLTEGANHHDLIMLTGRPIELEEHFTDADGKERHLHTIKVPSIGRDGSIIGSQGILMDITARKQAEAQLADERNLLRSLLHSSTDAIYFKDCQSRFLRCSNAMVPLFNLSSPDEFIGKCDFDFQGEEHARRAFEDEQEIIRTGLPVIAKTEKEAWPDGRVTWALTSKMPLRNQAGEIVGTFGISKDITAIKQAEAELERERYFLESLLENSLDCVYFKDRQSRFLRCSKSLSQRFAISMADLIGKTDFDLFAAEHARPAFEDEQEIIRTGRPLVGKIEKEVAKDGRETWALTSKMALRNQAGEIVGTFGISKDITAIKQAEAELERTHNELVRASRLAGMAEVATSVLHNVGNVLNSINVAASLVDERVRTSRVADLHRLAKLLDEHAEDSAAFLTTDPKGRKVPDFIAQLAKKLGDEQAEVLGEITSLRANVEHVKEIIAMQQSYARVSGVFENIQVTDLLEDALRMNAGALARHDVKLVRDYTVLPPICTDKHKVLQILINLMRNAKYACDESGRADKQMILRATHAEGRLRIAVIDNGVGIPPENLTRIFNYGFTTRKDGHGFGLHSGALAARELGGSLTACSEGRGLGAVFTLELPCQPPAAATS
jgi:PAS domain S-box-containing protein